MHNIPKLLATSAHNSPETAFVFPDWPYGRTLRCQKRIWIENRGGYGFRFMEQTTNPKRGNTWNKPHASTYHGFAVFGENEEGKLAYFALGKYGATPELFQEAKALPLDDGQRAALAALEAESRQYNPNTWKEWEEKQAQANIGG